MTLKDINVLIDVLALTSQVERSQEQQLLIPPVATSDLVRSTVFSLSKDPRVGAEPAIKPPELRFVEILRDGLNNPFVRLHWRVRRSEVETSGVSRFNVFRRKISPLRPPQKFSRVGYEKINQGSTRKGKFSHENKSITQINSSLLQPSVLNPNVASELQTARARFQSSLNRPLPQGRRERLSSPTDGNNVVTNRSNFTNSLIEKRLKRIGTVNYRKFVRKDKNKFVTVKNREFVDITFDDKSVRFGDSYEYHITSIPESITDTLPSNRIEVQVEDTTPISPPTQLMIKIVNTSRARVSICMNPPDEVARAIVFKRSAADFQFEQIAAILNINDCINFTDTNLIYGETYIYRVFLQSIHGVISEPAEATFTALDQKATSRSRSNDLKIPVLETIQDQNSDNIKLTIPVNDERVAYYQVDRRNLTIREKGFSVPGRLSNYGDVGWGDNKLFVTRTRNLLRDESIENKDVLNRQTAATELNFVDTTTQKGHVYQYRIVGRDLYGNPSSHQFSTVRATGKKAVRSPINLRFEIVRDNPFRAKLIWDDDNEFEIHDSGDVFSTDEKDVAIAYKIQRRRTGRNQYESFPLTANNFLIDEVETDDAIPFESTKVTDQHKEKLPDKVRKNSRKARAKTRRRNKLRDDDEETSEEEEFPRKRASRRKIR